MNLGDLNNIPISVVFNFLGFVLTVVCGLFGIFKFFIVQIDKKATSIKSDIIPRITSMEENIRNTNTMLIFVIGNIAKVVDNEKHEK